VRLVRQFQAKVPRAGANASFRTQRSFCGGRPRAPPAADRSDYPEAGGGALISGQAGLYGND